MPDSQHWVGTWTTAPAPAETGAFTNQTLRMTMRASLGGDTVRVRISNAYGRRPLDVGGAHIALRDAGAAIVPGSDRELSFGGENTATIAAGAVLFSDPVGLGVPQLARRLTARPRGRPMAVMNEGLGGNRILFDIRGDSGLRRFDRDVLSQPGVTHVAVMLGTNDLRNRWRKPEEEPTAAQMIAGLKQIAQRAHTRGIKIIGATLTPV